MSGVKYKKLEIKDFEDTSTERAIRYDYSNFDISITSILNSPYVCKGCIHIILIIRGNVKDLITRSKNKNWLKATNKAVIKEIKKYNKRNKL